MYSRILIPLDGSEPSDHALTHAMNLAAKEEAELILLTVIAPVSALLYGDEESPTVDMEDYDRVLESSHRQVLTKAEKKVKGVYPDLKAKQLLARGHVPTTIIETAESEDVDLIVMGSRGFTGVKGWLLGSTSRHVVEHCTKPILIVK